jgi:type II secretory pathway component PulF
MANYHYEATDARGEPVTGVIHADSREDLVEILRADDLLLVSAIEVQPKSGSRASRVSRNDVVELVEQLASLTRAGVPLASGLRAASAELDSPSLRSTFIEMADMLDSGSNLEEALALSSRSFPMELRGLVLAGSRSGRLTDLLGEYVRAANLGSELRRLFWSTLAYPAFGLIFVIALVGFVCSLSIKAIDTLLDGLPDFGQRGKSGSIELLAAMARLITDHGLEILIGIVAVPLLVWATIRFTANPVQRRRILYSIPVIGPILLYCSLTEFCHLLGMLIEADLPLPLALELAGESVRDAEVADACGRIGQAIDEGEPLSTAVNRWESIPAGLGQLFRWSEDRRSLPEALHLAGEMFESRARSQSSFASSVLATMLLLLILWWVGFAIATLYLPMISLIGRLSG